MKLLQIDSSGRSTSVTRKLTAKFAEEWKKSYPTSRVIHRDLAASAVPLITDDWSATFLDASKLTPDQQSYLATSDQLIEELQSADTVVIGAPMYNFSIPAPLKAWIDHVVRIGKTFGYGPNGPQGLLGRKNVVVITSRGGAYEKGSARSAFDFQEPYLQHILGFIGLTDITFIHVENQASVQAPLSVATAGEQIEGIVAERGRRKVAQ
jgi:FMN-dependent NADH-azoreductase